ncbi:hypothetical protein ESCO_003999 [Escovopsis weberi]|uniref:Uncharacterized protein n=1 Tax=Escovopsis weberi TaxID=150374 RepID=A0A0M8N135_ESCWE|nr:hypothetical protein ESCO_003999 [Escovopsis weberi]
MWGSPIVGGVISHKSQTFTAQYRFICAFFLIALPLLVIGAPETAFDRAGAAVAPTPNSAFVPPASWAGPELENGDFKLSRKTLKPWSFKGDARLSTLVFQILRAFAAPTTILVFLLTFIPYVVLWCLASSLAQLLSPSPKDMDPPHIGVVMSGPLLLAVLSICCLLFYRTSYSKLTCRTTYLIVAGGTTCAVAGVLAYGLYLHQHIHHSGKHIKHNLPLLSFQLGLVAAGSDALGATIRPLLSRSASFTASSMAVAQRSIGNMYSAVIVMRNLFAGLFVLAMPWIVSAAGGLKWTAIIVGSVQAGLMILIVGLMLFLDESIWKLDGKVMGLLDLRSLRISAGFFDSD